MFKTDLHIHSCASPCADADMTPEAIVSAAVQAGLDLIAVTDHNTCRNSAAVQSAAEKAGISAVPGIEVTTIEDIHCICLFPDIGKVSSFSRWMDTLLPKPRTRPGAPAPKMTPEAVAARRQLEERKIAYMAREISITELSSAVERFRGIWWPAHVGKPYNSVLAILGSWPEDLQTWGAELFGNEARPESIPDGIPVLRVSDAHHLWELNSGGFEMALTSPDFNGLKHYLQPMAQH